eukprot:10894454-Ditylum_brightwellii.AAC.1
MVLHPYPSMSSSAATGTDPRYIAYCYDKLTSLSINHNDIQIVLNHGLAAAEDKTGGWGLKAGIDSPLLESIDSKQMVNNLCASQKGIEGTFSGYYFLRSYEQKGIKEAVNQASSTLYLHIWQEVT